MIQTDRFQPVFAHLRALLQPFEDQLVVEADDVSNYSLNTPYVAQFKKSLFFGGVQINKNYVSFHLMPVYIFPTLLDNLSPILKQRMQGKSCFKFTSLDQVEAIRGELEQLTARGFEQLKQQYGL